MRFRTAIVPAANIGSTLGYICVIVGLILWGLVGAGFGLTVAWAGILLFSLVVLFSLVTLPVEYDASNRARAMLQGNGLVTVDEASGVSAVLSAAALTYVASLLQSLAQLFYFITLVSGSSRRS